MYSFQSVDSIIQCAITAKVLCILDPKTVICAMYHSFCGRTSCLNAKRTTSEISSFTLTDFFYY